VAAIPIKVNLDTASLEFLGRGADETDSNLIIDFLLSKPSYYSTIISVNGEKKKKFSFPSTFSMGEFSCQNIEGSKPAQGEIIVPLNSAVTITAGQPMLTNVELLRYFRADDLSGLKFGAVDGESQQVMRCIAKLTGLKDLQLLNVPLENNGVHTKSVSPVLEALKRSKSLTHLSLRDTSLTKADIDTICAIQPLTDLTLANLPITDADLDQLSRNKTLAYLNLGQANRLTRACLKSLKKFDRLRTLAIAGDVLEPSDDQELEKALPKLITVIL